MASFDILMQMFCKLQQGKMEKMTLYLTQLEGALNVGQQEYPMMLNPCEVQKHIRNFLFHGLCKQLHNSMHYLYNDTKIT